MKRRKRASTVLILPKKVGKVKGKTLNREGKEIRGRTLDR